MNEKLKGFTIIEVIITVAILGAMASFMFVKFPATTERARDAKRMSDLKTYQTALESWASKNGGLYPVKPAGTDITSMCSDLGIPTEDCPNDPKGVVYSYDSSTSGNVYTIKAQLENIKGDFAVCSGGKSGNIPKSTTLSSGACPLFISINTPDNVAIFYNIASGKSCTTICGLTPYNICVDTGDNIEATNDYYHYTSGGTCRVALDGCTATMNDSGSACQPDSQWTLCRCRK